MEYTTITAEQARENAADGVNAILNRVYRAISEKSKVGAHSVRVWTDHTLKEDEKALQSLQNTLKDAGFESFLTWENINEYSITVKW